MTIFPSPLSLSLFHFDAQMTFYPYVRLFYFIFFYYSQLSVAACVGKSAFLVHNPSVFFCSIPRGNLGVGEIPHSTTTNSFAALKQYFYTIIITYYRFLFQFSIYSFCLVQFHAGLFSGYYVNFPMIVTLGLKYIGCFCNVICKSATLPFL